MSFRNIVLDAVFCFHCGCEMTLTKDEHGTYYVCEGCGKEK